MISAGVYVLRQGVHASPRQRPCRTLGPNDPIASKGAFRAWTRRATLGYRYDPSICFHVIRDRERDPDELERTKDMKFRHLTMIAAGLLLTAATQHADSRP